MIVHSEKYFKNSTTAIVPGSELLQRVLYECERAYIPVVWTLPDDFDTYDAYLRALKRLDMTSSPGFPYQTEAPTNGDWLRWNGISCDEFQVQRLWYDVKLVLSDQWDSIIRVFVKQEPHKQSKIDEKRWRLIMASSLCVQIAWHMLFDYMNDLEISKAYEIPSQQGIILVAGGWKQFKAQWESKGYSCGLDKSAWDWTAPKWALDLDLVFRYRMGRGARMEDWMNIAVVLYRHMFEDPKIMTSDGLLFRQVVPGIMKSGCVSTISTNSHCQVFVHLVVCVEKGLPFEPLPSCCGDDTLQHEMHAQDIEVYKRYGVVVKSASDTLEFVGHEFRSSGPAPMYIMKHLKNFLYTKEENLLQFLDSMARMYVHVPQYKYWETLARKAGYNLPLSQEAYRFWYDFEA